MNTTLLTTLLIASAGGTWLALARTDAPDIAPPTVAGMTDYPLDDALTFDWPRFRGANGLGVVAMAAILPDVDEATISERFSFTACMNICSFFSYYSFTFHCSNYSITNYNRSDIFY